VQFWVVLRVMGFTADKIGTRRPNQISLLPTQEGETPYVMFNNEPTKYTEDNDILAKLVAFNAIDGISEVPFTTRVYSHGARGTVLFDLPGTQISSPDPSYPHMPQDIYSMIEKVYHGDTSDGSEMEDLQNNICIMTQVASQDRVTSSAVNFINTKIDPSGQNTLRLLTKLDTVGMLTPDSQTYKLLMNKQYTKRYGTVGLACPIGENNDINQAIKNEYAVLKKYGYFQDNEVAKRANTENVRNILSDIYMNKVIHEYPLFRPELIRYMDTMVEKHNTFKEISSSGSHRLIVNEIQQFFNIFNPLSDERNDLQKELIGSFNSMIYTCINELVADKYDLKPRPDGLGDGMGYDQHKYSTSLIPDAIGTIKRPNVPNSPVDFFAEMTRFGKGPIMDNYSPETIRKMTAKYNRTIMDSIHGNIITADEFDLRKRRNEFCAVNDKIINELLETDLLDELLEKFIGGIRISYEEHVSGNHSHQFLYYALENIICEKESLKSNMIGILLSKYKFDLDPAKITYELNEEGVTTEETGFINTWFKNEKVKELKLFSNEHLSIHKKILSKELSTNLTSLLFSEIIDKIFSDVLQFTLDELLSKQNIDMKTQTTEEEIEAINEVIKTLDECHEDYLGTT
jgi:hypothetical protein